MRNILQRVVSISVLNLTTHRYIYIWCIIWRDDEQLTCIELFHQLDSFSLDLIIIIIKRLFKKYMYREITYLRFKQVSQHGSLSARTRMLSFRLIKTKTWFVIKRWISLNNRSCLDRAFVSSVEFSNIVNSVLSKTEMLLIKDCSLLLLHGARSGIQTNAWVRVRETSPALDHDHVFLLRVVIGWLYCLQPYWS